MSERCVRRFAWGAVLVAAFSGGAVAQTPPGLVEAQFNARQDPFGMNWTLDGQGCVRCDGGGAYSANAMTIEGSAFSAGSAQMSPDAGEYFLAGDCNGLSVARRIKIDAKSGTLRYFETFQNPRNSAVTVTVVLGTRFSRPIAGLIPSSGAPAARPGAAPAVTLGENDCGFVALGAAARQPTCLAYYVAAAQSKLKPTVQRTGSSQLNVQFPITIPPQQTVALLHGFAVRPQPGQPDAAQLAKLFQPFQSNQWGRDLPPASRKMVLNGGGNAPAEEPPAAAALQQVAALAERCDVQRNKGDVLVAEERTQMTGAVRGGGLTVATRFGTVKLPLDEAALVVGGAGIDRAMAVHLRNGEILVGPVEFQNAVLKADSGFEVQLSAKQVNYLFFRAEAADGKLPAEAVALVTTHRGDRLALGGKPAAGFRTVTPWGPMEVGLSDVESLVLVRSPQPIYRLTTTDGSRWSLMLGGEAWKLPTLRFGTLAVAPNAVARLASAKAAATAAEADDEGPKSPHCRLLGNNVVVGEIAADKLQIETSAGTTTVETANILNIEAAGDAVRGLLTVQMLDEGQISGRLADGVLPIRTRGQVWRFPARHVTAFHSMKEKPAEAAEPAEEGSAAGKPADKAGAKERVKKKEKPSAAAEAEPPPPELPPEKTDDSDDPFAP